MLRSISAVQHRKCLVERTSTVVTRRERSRLNSDRYHWALIIGPKTESQDATGRRLHAKETLQRMPEGDIRNVWSFEDRESTLEPTSAILVRIMIGKVVDVARLRAAFARTPIRAGTAGYEGWNCVHWVQEAISYAVADGKALGTCLADWAKIRDTVMWYVAKKEGEHRFDGQVLHNQKKVATWDALEGKELIP